MQEDKWKHITASFMIASVSSVPYQITGKDEYMLGAIGIAMLAGLAKEYHDATVPGGTGWDWNDIGADVAGIAISVGLQYLAKTMGN